MMEMHVIAGLAMSFMLPLDGSVLVRRTVFRRLLISKMRLPVLMQIQMNKYNLFLSFFSVN